MQRNIDVNRIAMFVLRLTKADSTVTNVLAAKTRSIFAPARSKAQQVESEPGLRSERVPFVILSNLFVGPSVMSI